MSTKTNSGMKTYVPTPPPSSQQQAPPTLLNLLSRRPVSQPQRPQSSQSRPTTAPPPPSPRTPRKKAPPQKKPQTARAYESPKQLNIVLPPRRFSSLSSSCLADCSTTSVGNNEVKINSLHFSDSYTPHKEYWIRNALEKLGNTWVRDKKITQTELLSKAFEEKMGVLYELAMAKKHESIDRLVDEVQDEEVVKEKKSKRRKKPIEPPVLQDNFPFSPQLSDTLKRTMSSLLLDIMKQGQQGQGEQKKPTQQRVLDKKPHDKMDESLSSLGSVAKTPLTQCYVLDGKLVVGGKKLLAIGGSILNQFSDTSKSRVRSSTEEKSYFRKTANMMGFLSHEISIRYCKKGHRIIVSGSRAQRNDSENARQVREVVLVPKDVSIHGLLVMRTTKGSLIFEEPTIA
ncbi:hypothetical protein Ocin01_07352 [Orchesella cincta]|uniref:Uncharacterized protein n=1 Tax=Orchesella cincta TaxID=48709 RepID=A0A1D2N230_ORCCI|nr:hypothetical protein Ocin01_07352 [Orchesella cincta]